MGRFVVFLYGVIAYFVGLSSLCYLFAFTGGWLVPKTINSGSGLALGIPWLANLALISLFAIQHAVMARPAFKEKWTKIIPKSAERSTFVLLSAVILWFIMFAWQPMPSVLYQVSSEFVAKAMLGISLAGYLFGVYSSFLIDHFDLFGLKQTFCYLTGKTYHDAPFVQPWVYTKVRHPLMLGFLIGFWVTPTMTTGHLLFATAWTVYILIGVRMEERDLATQLGPPYKNYQAKTPMLIPFLQAK